MTYIVYVRADNDLPSLMLKTELIVGECYVVENGITSR